MDELLKRLNKIEGQVRGVRRMIEEGRDCTDILTQLSAVRMGVHKVSLLVMAEYFNKCVVEELGDDYESNEALERAAKLMSKYL